MHLRRINDVETILPRCIYGTEMAHLSCTNDVEKMLLRSTERVEKTFLRP